MKNFVRQLQKFPFNGFNYALIYAKDSAGKEWWIDPANPKVIPDVLSADILGGVSLVLDGTPEIAKILPKKNPIASRWDLLQSIKVNPDNSAEVHANAESNVPAYNFFAKEEKRIGKETMEKSLGYLMNPNSGKTTVVYNVLSKSNGKVKYLMNFNSFGLVREKPGFDVAVFINHLAFLLLKFKAQEDHDFQDEGSAHVVTTLKGQHAVDPSDHECIVRSLWADYDRFLDYKGPDTIITDNFFVKHRFIPEAEAKSDDFKDLIDRTMDCALSAMITIKEIPGAKSNANQELDKMKGPPVEQMTEADADKMRENADINLAVYFQKKLYKYESLRIERKDHVPEAYRKRARIIASIGELHDDEYRRPYTEAALKDVLQGIAALQGKPDPLLLADKIRWNLKLGNVAEAKADFVVLYAQAPALYETLYEGYELNKALNLMPNAEKWLRLALLRAQKLSDQRRSLGQLALLLSSLNRHDEAMKVYNQILAFQQVGPWDYHNAAIEYCNQKDYGKCSDLEQKALSLTNLPVAKRQLALALAAKAKLLESGGGPPAAAVPAGAQAGKQTPVVKEDPESVYSEALKWDENCVPALLGSGRLYLAQFNSRRVKRLGSGESILSSTRWN